MSMTPSPRSRSLGPRGFSPALALVVLSVVLLGAAGCGASLIPNTEVEDTSDNRDAIKYAEQYRKAVEARDVGRLLAMASPDYFDDNGTPDASDDVNFDRLREQLSKWNASLLEARYEIRYRGVLQVRDRVVIDYTYTGSFRVKTAEGERALRRLDDNRLVLRRTGDGFRVLSGM
jgi:hypothetical protein